MAVGYTDGGLRVGVGCGYGGCGDDGGDGGRVLSGRWGLVAWVRMRDSFGGINRFAPEVELPVDQSTGLFIGLVVFDDDGPCTDTAFAPMIDVSIGQGMCTTALTNA